MEDLLYGNPWRPPDAWWRRATGIISCDDLGASVRRDSGRGCTWIKKAMRFLHAIHKAKSQHEQLDVVADFPAIFWAHWVFEQTTNNLPVRWAMEGRILARQTNAEIAQANGCSPETIEAFESLFFNVRDRLNHSDFILNSVLGKAAFGDIKARDHGLLCKLVGYLAGPHAFEAMNSHIPNPIWANRPEDVGTFFVDAALNLMRKKAAMAALTVPVDAHTQMQLLEAFVKYAKMASTMDLSDSAGVSLQKNLRKMFAGLPFVDASRDRSKQRSVYSLSAS